MEVFSQRRRCQDGLNQLKENAEFVTIHEEHCLVIVTKHFMKNHFDHL